MKSQQQLSREAVEEFKGIYREEFGRDISDDEASEMGFWLLDFLKILLESNARRTRG
jgi:hypothetical protein